MAKTIVGKQLIGGRWLDGGATDEVFNPFDLQIVGTVVAGSREDAAAAISAARESLKEPFPAHQRHKVLMEAARLIDAKADELANIIALEGSKTLREAKREPPRAAEILRLSAEASRRIQGSTLPFDSKPGSESRVGWYQREPVGVVVAIQPFNDPMAVAAHKVGPALAGGNAVVLKPDSRTPFTPIRLAQALTDAGLPAGRLNVVTGEGPVVGDALVRDPRVRLISFTGGVETGRRISAAAGLKKLVFELGSNSAVIVMDDADLDRAVPAIVAGAFAQAGENCLGVQRVIIHESVYNEVKDRIVASTRMLKAGHSLDDSVDVCAMMRESEAERVWEWIQEAIGAGARLLCGGHRHGAVLEPTVLESVPEGSKLDCDEAYGPVVSLYKAASLDAAIDRANSVPFGLHAALFTNRLDAAISASKRLDVGGVIINDSTDYRLDMMPFGGVKGSGLGREGIGHALESMTEPKVICIDP